MQAFTLNEMLLVVAILLLLGAIVVSLVRMAREASTRTGCANNLKQLYASLMSYVEEYGAPPWLPYNWVQHQPEIRSILICPKDHSKGFMFPEGEPRGEFSWEKYVPLSYEPLYLVRWNLLRRPPTMQEMKDPRQVLLVCTWHELGPGQKTSEAYQAIFGDGHIGKYEFPGTLYEEIRRRNLNRSQDERR
jgi:hypothetical protein